MIPEKQRGNADHHAGDQDGRHHQPVKQRARPPGDRVDQDRPCRADRHRQTHNRQRNKKGVAKGDGKAFDVESKSLQTNTIKFDEESQTWTAKTQVDASDRRDVTLSSGKKLNTTLLKRGEFDILAVNCFGFGNKWKFLFAKNSDLPSSIFKKYEEPDRAELIASMIKVELPVKLPFYENLKDLLDSMIEKGLGKLPDESLFNKN